MRGMIDQHSEGDQERSENTNDDQRDQQEVVAAAIVRLFERREIMLQKIPLPVGALEVVSHARHCPNSFSRPPIHPCA